MLQRGMGGWACFSSNMYVCIMTLMAFVRKEILFFPASEVSVQGPWKIISSPRQAKLSAILTGFEKCVCACVHICALTAALWSPPPPHFFLFTTHTSPLHRFPAVSGQSLPSFFQLPLPASHCVCCHGDHWCSLPTQCLLLCRGEAELWLMMQTDRGRHHFPWEWGLFLPVSTKYSTCLWSPISSQQTRMAASVQLHISVPLRLFLAATIMLFYICLVASVVPYQCVNSTLGW